jgi:hypothetical protein
MFQESLAFANCWIQQCSIYAKTISEGTVRNTAIIGNNPTVTYGLLEFTIGRNVLCHGLPRSVRSRMCSCSKSILVLLL